MLGHIFIDFFRCKSLQDQMQTNLYQKSPSFARASFSSRAMLMCNTAGNSTF